MKSREYITNKCSCYNQRQFIQIDDIQAYKFVQTDASFRTEKFEQNNDEICKFHKAKNGFYKFIRSK